MDKINTVAKNECNLLEKISKQITLTNKLYLSYYEHEILNFFLNNPYFFVTLLSKFYPLNINIIKKYKLMYEYNDFLHKTLNSDLLENEIIENEIDFFCRYFGDRTINEELYRNHYFEKEEIINIIEKEERNSFMKEKDNFSYFFSYNKLIKWDNELVIKIYNTRNFFSCNYQMGFYNNPSIRWNIELLDVLQDKIDWIEITNSKNVDWCEEVIDKHIDKWNWRIEYKGNPMGEYEIPVYGFNSFFPIEIDKRILIKYKDKWDWDLLTRNPSIKWTKKLIKKFKRKIIWKDIQFETSPSLHNAYEYYNYPKYYINFSKLYPFIIDEKTIDKYLDYWQWNSLLSNRMFSVKVDMRFLDKYKNYLIQDGELIPEIYRLLDINFEEIHNQILRDSTTSFSKPWYIKQYLYWGWYQNYGKKYFFEYNKELNVNYFIKNKIQYNSILGQEIINYLRVKKDTLNWIAISQSPCLPWCIDFIDEFYEYINWLNLSLNTGVPWSYELIDKYSNDIVFYFTTSYNGNLGDKNCHCESYFNHNASVPWNEEFIYYYKDKLKWDGKNGIIRCLNINWNENFIDRVINYFSFEDLFLRKDFLITEHFLEKYKDKIDFKFLTGNYILKIKLTGLNDLPWSFEFVKKYERYLDLDHCSQEFMQIIYNKSFKNIINEKIIEKFFNTIYFENNKLLLDKLFKKKKYFDCNWIANYNIENHIEKNYSSVYKAKTLIKRTYYVKASEYLNKLVEEKHNSLELIIYLNALCYYYQRNYKKASEEFEKIKNPNNYTKFYYYLACCKNNLNDLNGAIHFYNKFISLSSDKDYIAKTHFELSIIYKSVDNFEKSLEEINNFLNYSINKKSLLLRAELFTKNGNPFLAEKDLLNAYNLVKYSPLIYELLGDLKYQIGEKKSALYLWNKVLQLVFYDKNNYLKILEIENKIKSAINE